MRNLPIAWVFGVAVAGALAAPALGEKDYYRDVYPFLKGNCVACHNKTTTKAGLNMETPELVRKGGESGPAVIPGKAAESLMVRSALHQEDSTMPPKNNKSGAVDLTAAQIEILKTWINEGAKDSTQEIRSVEFHALPKSVNPIYAVALTDEGRMAVCSRANQIHLYDLPTQTFLGRVGDASGAAHRSSIQSIAVSPDGNWMASAGFREVKLWKREKGAAVRWAPEAGLKLLRAIGLGESREVLGVDAAGDLVLLEIGTWKQKVRWPGIGAGVTKMEVSPDRSAVWMAWESGKSGVWSLQEGTWLGGKEELEGIVASWSVDSQSVAVVGADKMIRVWKRSAAASSGWQKSGEWPAGAAISSLVWDSKARVAGVGVDGKVRFWSSADGKLVRELVSAGVISIGVSSDGKSLAAGGADGLTRVFETDTGKVMQELRFDLDGARRVEALDWQGARHGLEVSHLTKEIARVEGQNKALDELLKKANDTIASVQKGLPDQQKAVPPAQEKKTAAQQEVDKVVALVKAAPNGQPDATLQKQQKDAQDKFAAAMMVERTAVFAVTAAEHQISDAKVEVERIQRSKGENNKVLADFNAQLKQSKDAQAKAVEELAALKKTPQAAPYKALHVAWSADGKRLATVGSDGWVRTWSFPAAVPTERERLSEGALDTAWVRFGGEGRWTAVSASGAVVESGLRSRWTLARTLGGDKSDVFADRVNAVRFSPDSRVLAVGGGEPSRTGDISLWEVASGKVVQNWKERHTDAVLSLDFSADGKWLASGASDKLAKVTEVASGKQVYLLEGHTHHVLGVGFRADGRVLATAGGDGVVLVWDMSHGERKKKIDGWSKEVTSIHYIGATQQLVTSAGDNLVRIVTDEGTEVRSIAKLPEFMQAAASTPTASLLVGGGEDSVLRVWEGSSGKEVVAFELK